MPYEGGARIRRMGRKRAARTSRRTTPIPKRPPPSHAEEAMIGDRRDLDAPERMTA
jgi:hypothetical protein